MAASTSLSTYVPEDYPHEGCAVRVKTRHVTVPKGVRAYVEWSIRDADGAEIDLSELFPTADESESTSEEIATGSVHVRIAPVDGTPCYDITDGECLTPTTGTVRFQLPVNVANFAGIYRMDIGIKDDEGELVLVDHGLLFVEPTLFGNVSRGMLQGPPTLKEIRSYIRDTARENDFLQEVEFDEAELVTAIIAPVREWNETLPPGPRYTTQNFPYKEHWIRGILGHLCEMAAAWYLRNKHQTEFGGVGQDDRNKNAEYAQQAQLYKSQWRRFLVGEKARLNAKRGFGSIDGPYY